MSKIKKGDLIRDRYNDDRGLVVGTRLNGLLRVLWLTGSEEGLRYWSNPNYLVKVEVQGE